MIFETDRLIVKPWNLEWAPSALRMYGNPEVMRYLGRNGAGAVIGSLDEMRERLGKAIAKFGSDSSGHIYAAVALKSNSEVIGTVLLKSLELSSGEIAEDEIEIGWHLAQEHWCKGYGTEVGHGVLEYGLATLKLPEVHAIAYPENLASIRIMQKIGMKHQGTTDRYYGVTTEHYLAQR